MKWWRRLVHGRDLERQLERELQSHIEDEIDANIAAGMSEEEARRAALKLFGSVSAVKEDVRRTWGWSWIGALALDLRFAIRVFRRNLPFTIVSMLLLGVGIGTTSVMIMLMKGVFWDPIPARDPQELRMVSWTSPTLKYAGTLTYGSYALLKDRLDLDLACSWRSRSSMGDAGPMSFQLVTGNYFQVLGIEPERGRLLTPDDDELSAAPVAVISHQLWRRAYGGRADVLQRDVRIAGRSFPIVGVMAEGFAGLWPMEPQDVMVPFSNAAAFGSFVPPRDRRLWSCTETIGRLRGISEEPLRTQAQAVLQEQFVIAPNRDSKDARVLVTDLRAFRGMVNLQENSAAPLQLLLTAAGIILLLTCINIAGLLLVRGRARRAEFATRLALGARRSRLVRQLVTESMLLAAGGGLLGVVLTYLAVPLLPELLADLSGRSWLTPTMTPGVDLTPDPLVLGITLLLALTTGVVFGVVPALRTTRDALVTAIRGRGHRDQGKQGITAGKVLICSQLALSMVLSLGATMLTRTLLNLQSVPMGFRPTGVVFVETDPSRSGPTFVPDLLRQLRDVPGVSAAAVSQWPLYNNLPPRLPVCVPRYGESGMDIEPVSPGYFETWGVRLLVGRDFTAQDAGGNVIINDAFARTFFPGENPIGQQIGIGSCPGSTRSVIGVVEDHRDRQRVEVAPMVYGMYRLRTAPTTFAVRTGNDARFVIPVIRRLLQEHGATVDGDVMTGTEYLEREWHRERLLAACLVTFGILALVISCLGIYGTLSYLVTWRTPEIGIRMALGARTSAVKVMVLRESLLPVVVGIVLGCGAAFGLSRFLESLLFGITAQDLRSTILAAGVLIAAAGIAAFVPARRASRIDPMHALRHE